MGLNIVVVLSSHFGWFPANSNGPLSRASRLAATTVVFAPVIPVFLKEK